MDETDGQQKHIINLKGRGTAPLTDLIRVHALACGSKAQNLERLDANIGKLSCCSPKPRPIALRPESQPGACATSHGGGAEGAQPNNWRIEPEKSQ